MKLVRQAGEQLAQILAASQKVAATIADISAASGEQANGIDEMSQAVAHLDEMTQQNAALAEQSAASAGSLSGKIGQLNDLVAAFRTGPETAAQQRACARAAAARRRQRRRASRPPSPSACALCAEAAFAPAARARPKEGRQQPRRRCRLGGVLDRRATPQPSPARSRVSGVSKDGPGGSRDHWTIL